MAIKFETNVPLKLTFPWGDFQEVNSRYGQQFAYSVEHAGQRDKLFATPVLHHKLQEAGIRAGSEFTITKIEIEGNRKDWRIEGEEAPAPVAVVQQQAQATGKAGNNGHAQKNGHAQESPGFQDLKQAMQICLNTSTSHIGPKTSGKAFYSAAGRPSGEYDQGQSGTCRRG